MNNNLNMNPPAIVAPAFVLSAKTQSLIDSAVKKVEKGGEAFLTAYKATLKEAIPSWEQLRQINPDKFADKLMEVEDLLKDQCLRRGMSVATFGRYRTAARKATLLKLPFRLAAATTRAEAKAIAANPALANTVFKKRRHRQAIALLADEATVLPFPTEKDDPEEYFKLMHQRLDAHLGRLKQRFGEETFNKMMDQVTEGGEDTQEADELR